MTKEQRLKKDILQKKDLKLMELYLYVLPYFLLGF